MQDAFNSFFWNGDSEAVRDQAMREEYEGRRTEYEIRIKEWLSESNRERFKGKTLEEMISEIGNERFPIGEVPIEKQEYFDVDDSRIFFW